MELIPTFVRALIPKIVITAYKSAPEKLKLNPDVKGRTSSIKNDDVESLAYICKTKQNSDKRLSLRKDSRGLFPWEFALLLKKYKCVGYYYLNGSFKLTYAEKRDLVKSNIPRWLKFLIYVDIDKDEFYYWNQNRLISNAMSREMPINWIIYYLNKYNQLGNDEKKKKQPLSERKGDSAVDIPFFSKLSYQEKLRLVQLIYKNDLHFDIRACIESESLEIRAYFYSFNYLIDETKKLNNFDIFTTFVDNHRSDFDELSEYSIIVSGNSAYYNYAYQNVKKIKTSTDGMHQHVLKLIDQKSIPEIKFMKAKGYIPSMDVKIKAMMTLDKEIIDSVFNKIDTTHIFFHLFINDFKGINKLWQMGYRATIYQITDLYSYKISGRSCRDLSAIKLISEKEYLDDLKKPIVEYHSDILFEFIEKYSDRFRDFGRYWYQGSIEDISLYEKLCEKIGAEQRMILAH